MICQICLWYESYFLINFHQLNRSFVLYICSSSSLPQYKKKAIYNLNYITINQRTVIMDQQPALNHQPQPNQELQMSTNPAYQKLQDLDQINPIILLKQPELFKETFLKITKTALLLFRNKELQKGLLLFNKAIDMLDLGKNILKDSISKYLKLTIFVNLSYGYQNLRKLQKASRFCQRAKEQLQKLITAAKDDDQSIQKYLKLSKFLITLKFQHCAIVSQLQQHEKALQMCKSTLPQLKKQLQTMLKYLRQSSSSKLLQKKTGQTVQFSRHVQKFAETMLVDMINYLNQPLKKFHFYHWQKNPELNQEQLRKKFIPSNLQARNECKRSILGVSKSSSWMDEFNIGSIMHMSMVTVQDFEITLPMEEYYFKDKLYEIVILCSLSYFTMATEIRFLEPLRQSQTTSNRQFSSRASSSIREPQYRSQESAIQTCQSSQISSMQPQLGTHTRSQTAQVILKKYGYQKRSQMNKLSQLYHLRSIEIVSRHIQTVIPYLIHIIKSYDKHYLKKKQLQPIAAINEESQMSLMNESVQEYLPQEKIYNDYIQKDEDRSRNDEPMGDLLLQSQDKYRSNILSGNKSDQKGSQKKARNQDLIQVKNVLELNNIQVQASLEQKDFSSTLHQKNSKFKKDLSKIIQDSKLQNQIDIHSNAIENNQQNKNHHEFNDIAGGQYLISKRTMNAVKSSKNNKNTDSKRTKSKSKLNFIKSKQKPVLSKSRQKILKKNDTTSKNSIKNIYTYRSPQDQKRAISRPHYQSNKLAITQNTQQIKKYQSPQLMTINQSKKRLKTQLTDNSRQKLLKKFIGIPQSQYEDEKQAPNKGQKKNTNKNSDKKPKLHQQQKKKDSKYFTTFDGEKQYRIKHESTTHIKVLYKKKHLHTEREEV